MKKLFFIFCFCLSFLAIRAYAVDISATTFVSTVVDDIIQNVLSTEDSKDAKTIAFEERVLKAIDTQAIAKTVLAQFWKTATPKEKDEFIQAFKDMAVKMTSDKFNLYTGQKMQFFAERPAQGKNQVFVDSSIETDDKPIQVVWRVREKDGQYKIIDIIIEGVSMTLSYRNEYTTFLQTHTIAELIERIKQQTTEFEQKNEQNTVKTNAE